MRKKICIVSNTARSVFNFRFNLMQEINKYSYDVIALAPYDKYAEGIKKKFKFIKIKSLTRSGKNPITDFILFLEFLRNFKKIKPDFVINFTIKPNIYSSFACKMLNIKYICSVTGLGHIFLKHTFTSFIVKLLFKIVFSFSNMVICQNKDDVALLVKQGLVKEHKVTLTPGSGVDINKFSSNNIKRERNGKNTSFIMVSRLIEEKGVKEYVYAAKKVREENKKVKCYLLGPIDTDNPSCIKESQIESWNNEGLIEYLGETSNIKKYLEMADYVVLPSYYREGIPRILLEALAMGKPIITTDSVGCREAVENGKNGIMIPVKNTKALADAMKKMINLNNNEYKKMSTYCRLKACNEFNEQIVIKKYLNEIKKAIC